MSAGSLSDATVLLDCRWLGPEGAGRATQLLLRGLAEQRPSGRWILWGSHEVDALRWEGAVWQRTDSSPLAVFGQRDVLRVPRADVSIHMHQIRPIRPGRPSVTVVHDTAPIRHGGPAGARLLKRSFLRAVARTSSRVVTVSHQAKATIERDLRVDGSRIRVVRYPVDDEMVSRVRRLRGELAPKDVALYVGRFARHKNLPALVEAFSRTKFRARGGRLLLVGGGWTELAGARDVDGVDVEGPRPRAELEEVYATSRLLVLPSFEESFGLPAWEAASCGVPVAVSTGGALPEIYEGVAEFFAPDSTAEMAAAIDRASEREVAGESLVAGPSVREFAGVFVEEVERALTGM